MPHQVPVFKRGVRLTLSSTAAKIFATPPVATNSPLQHRVSLRCLAIAPSPSLQSFQRSTHRHCTQRFLPQNQPFGTLNGVQNLNELNLSVGGDRTPTITLQAQFGSVKAMAIAP
jgi:hypothetical protein